MGSRYKLSIRVSAKTILGMEQYTGFSAHTRLEAIGLFCKKRVEEFTLEQVMVRRNIDGVENERSRNE